MTDPAVPDEFVALFDHPHRCFEPSDEKGNGRLSTPMHVPCDIASHVHLVIVTDGHSASKGAPDA